MEEITGDVIEETKREIDQNSIKTEFSPLVHGAPARFLSGSKVRRLRVRVSPREIPAQRGIYSSSAYLNGTQRLKPTVTDSYLIFPPCQHLTVQLNGYRVCLVLCLRSLHYFY